MTLANFIFQLSKLSRSKSILNLTHNFSTLTSNHHLAIVNSSKNLPKLCKQTNLTSLLCTNVIQTKVVQTHRCYTSSNNSSEDNDKPYKRKERLLPKFEKNDIIIWPSIFKTIKNLACVLFVKMYIDKDFSLIEFVTGSKKALEIVSKRLAAADFAALEDLLDPETLSKLRMIVGTMTPAQRSQIEINYNEIYFSFPYEVGIVTEGSNGNDGKRKMFLEIEMIYHAAKEFKGKNMNPDISIFAGVPAEYRDRISICNYRFIKEFTAGVESDWTINYVDHNKPSDDIDLDE